MMSVTDLIIDPFSSDRIVLEPTVGTGLFMNDGTSAPESAPPRIVSATIEPALERQLSTLQLAVDPNNPNQELMLSIDWGDGSAPEVLACPSDPGELQLTHRYAHDGQFNVKVSLVNADGTIPAETTLPHNVLNVDLIVVGAGPGAGPHVKVFDSNTQELKFSFTPYPNNFRGGVRVATGDVNGDGIPDLITAPGAGKSGGHVKVFDGVTGALESSFVAYPGFLGGVYVAAGDVNGDGRDDIITGPDRGAGPHVKAFDVSTTQVISSFFAYFPGFMGGVRVAAGDVNGDGFADIITAPGAGRSGGHVKVFDGASNTLLSSFLAFPGFNGGIFVAAGDVNGDGRDDIITGADRGGPPHVKVFDAGTTQVISSFFAYPGFNGSVRVAAGDVNGDGRDDIITAAGSRRLPVRAFDGGSLEALDAIFAAEARNATGLFIAASR